MRNQVTISKSEIQEFRQLREIQASKQGLTPSQSRRLCELETLYVGARIVPILRDKVKPLLEDFGAPIQVIIEMDNAGEIHYGSRRPSSPSAPVIP